MNVESNVTRPILVAVDFSNCSREALVTAAKLADSFTAPLVILHVVHESPGRNAYPRRRNGQISLAPLEEIATGMFDDLVAELSMAHPEIRSLSNARREVVNGLPSSRICEVAARDNARLIVMGSHGTGGVAKVILGSISEEVLHRSQVPITVVKSDGTVPESVRPGAEFGGRAQVM